MAAADSAIFWDKAARKYAADPIADLGGYERTLERVGAVLKPDAEVLELGCGTGSTAFRLADSVSHLLATDISAAMIAIADEKLVASPIPNLSFRRATAEQLAQEGTTFDAVLGFNYLHLVGDLASTLRHIRNLTRPGGLFISKTPSVGEMNPVIRLALPVMRLIGKAPHVNVFTAADLAQAITAAGFEIGAQERHATKGKDRRTFIVARRH